MSNTSNNVTLDFTQSDRSLQITGGRDPHTDKAWFRFDRWGLGLTIRLSDKALAKVRDLCDTMPSAKGESK